MYMFVIISVGRSLNYLSLNPLPFTKDTLSVKALTLSSASTKDVLNGLAFMLMLP